LSLYLNPLAMKTKSGWTYHKTLRENGLVFSQH
jgi:hypothetical protein